MLQVLIRKGRVVAEKVPAPNASPGGLLIIDTPNRGGLDYALFKGRYWGGYHIPRHFHLFNQPHLVRLLEETGYQIFRRGYTPSLAFWVGIL